MLRAAAVFPARFTAAPSVAAAAAELRSPLLRVLGALRGGGGGGRSMLVGKRARFCSNSTSDPEAAAAEAKTEDAAVAEGEADGKASSAIVPANPRPEDFLTVRPSLAWTRITRIAASVIGCGIRNIRLYLI